MWVSYLEKCECELQNGLQIQKYQPGRCQKSGFQKFGSQREGGETCEVHIIT